MVAYEFQVRHGAFALSLISVPLNFQVLEALEEEPRSLRDLRQLVGVYAASAMRKQLRPLTDLEAVLCCQHPEFPGLKYELGAAGTELLEIGRLVQDWLDDYPEGRMGLGSVAAEGGIRALVEGWNSKIVRAIVARPRCLTDIDALIPALSYPSLERRFSALRDYGLIEPRPRRERRVPFAPTRWLRRAGGPLLAAAQWERRYAVAEMTGERFDFETVFLLASLGRALSDEASGRCRLAVEFRDDSGELALIGVQLQVVEGEIRSFVARPGGKVDTSASGSPIAWIRALKKGAPADLYLSGDRHLTREIINVLSRELFGVGRYGGLSQY
jgi:DNA-binding HxlR family transcriptional regulator